VLSYLVMRILSLRRGEKQAAIGFVRPWDGWMQIGSKRDQGTGRDSDSAECTQGGIACKIRTVTSQKGNPRLWMVVLKVGRTTLV